MSEEENKVDWIVTVPTFCKYCGYQQPIREIKNGFVTYQESHNTDCARYTNNKGFVRLAIK